MFSLGGDWFWTSARPDRLSKDGWVAVGVFNVVVHVPLFEVDAIVIFCVC